MSCDGVSGGALKEELNEQQVKELLSEVRHQTSLHWNFRRLKSLPRELLEECSHIEQMYLKCNLLMKLPNNLGCLSHLTYCHLNGNNLQSLPDSIGEMVSLQVLDVGNNKLKALPLTLSKLPSLRSLVAVYNQITYFPAELCCLQSLSLLMLSGNSLLHLPEAISGLTGLQGLYIDHNLLRELPRSLAALPILTRISCCCNHLTHLPAVAFISRPKVFFDNNSGINYLPFSLVRQLRSGESWNPVVMQTSGCFQDSAVVNNTVYISLSRSVKSGNSHWLVLPPQINTVTTSLSGSAKLPPLKEICLRSIWSGKQGSRNSTWHITNGINVGLLPSSLCVILEIGPVAYCETPGCEMPIFTHTSIIVVTISLSAKLYMEGSLVPTVMYFCCDSCAKQYTQSIQKMVDEFSLWLSGRLECACSIELV